MSMLENMLDNMIDIGKLNPRVGLGLCAVTSIGAAVLRWVWPDACGVLTGFVVFALWLMAFAGLMGCMAGYVNLALQHRRLSR